MAVVLKDFLSQSKVGMLLKWMEICTEDSLMMFPVQLMRTQQVTENKRTSLISNHPWCDLESRLKFKNRSETETIL